MYATWTWIALLAVSVVIELIAWRRPTSVSSVERTGAWIAIRTMGRVLLWALWVFAGVHLFTRYTLPR